MGILDQFLSQLSPGAGAATMGPDGNYYIANSTEGGSSGATPTITGYTGYSPSEIGSNTSQPGDFTTQFDPSGQFTGYGAYSPDSGNITFGDFAQGAEFVGAGALGFNAAFAGLGAGASGGSMAAGDGLDLGGGMTSADFSFGSDASAGDLFSSLGSSLGGSGLTGFSKLLPLFGQLLGGQQSRQSGNTANDLANRLIQASDPFAPYRAGYAQKLQQLESSHDVTSIPGFQAGLTAVQRAGAAQGFTGSGNMMNALSEYGGNFYNQELQRLAGLAGAGATPGAGFGQAAQLIGQGQASKGFGTQQMLQGIAGILGPGNPISDFMSNLGGGVGLEGNPMSVAGNAASSMTDLFAG